MPDLNNLHSSVYHCVKISGANCHRNGLVKLLRVVFIWIFVIFNTWSWYPGALTITEYQRDIKLIRRSALNGWIKSWSTQNFRILERFKRLKILFKKIQIILMGNYCFRFYNMFHPQPQNILDILLYYFILYNYIYIHIIIRVSNILVLIPCRL